MYVRSILVLVSLISTSAFATCSSAQVSQPRERFIVAHEHGWLNLRVDIVAPFGTSAEGESRRGSCPLMVAVDRELFGDEAVPVYEPEPGQFRATSGFRYPVPAGERRISLIYLGCAERMSNEEPLIHWPETEVEPVDVRVEDGHVVELSFDGEQLRVVSNGPPTEATEQPVSLDSVYELLLEVRELQSARPGS